jgi:DNA modification methylase
MDTNRVLFGDCRASLRLMAAEGMQVQTCVTSPPYYGLRDYGVDGQLGLEETPDEYVAALVDVFRCVRDVLADDGTLWLNIGDSYAANRGYQVASTLMNGKATNEAQAAGGRGMKAADYGVKPKDLIGIPWMVAFALRADGWYLRSDIIWSKGNPMPESVTDRPTKSHEYLFLLAKSERYYYDHEAVKEPAVSDHASGNGFKRDARLSYKDANGARGNDEQWTDIGGRRNRRSVWSVNTKPYKGAHFATFPPGLVEPCILAGTSAEGHCPVCSARWQRVTDRQATGWNGSRYGEAAQAATGGAISGGTARSTLGSSNGRLTAQYLTTGWQPTCACGADSVPDVVLDPFMGSGTTAAVAVDLRRGFLGCELNPEYEHLQTERITRARAALAERLAAAYAATAQGDLLNPNSSHTVVQFEGAKA